MSPCWEGGDKDEVRASEREGGGIYVDGCFLTHHEESHELQKLVR